MHVAEEPRIEAADLERALHARGCADSRLGDDLGAGHLKELIPKRNKISIGNKPDAQSIGAGIFRRSRRQGGEVRTTQNRDTEVDGPRSAHDEAAQFPEPGPATIE